MPIDRVIVISNNARKIGEEYVNELRAGASPKRIYEIQRDWKLVMKIMRMILGPYANELQSFIDEDLLRELGLI